MAVKSIVFDYGNATGYGMKVGSRCYAVSVDRRRVPMIVKVRAISRLKAKAFRASKHGEAIC